MEVSLGGFRPGGAVVRALRDYLSAPGAGWRLQVSNSGGNSLYVGYADSTHGAEQAKHVHVWLWDGGRGAVSWHATSRVARLAPGEWFTYEEWTIVVYASLPAAGARAGAAVVSLCRAGAGIACATGGATVALAPWGGLTAEVGSAYSGADVGGPVPGEDSAACIEACSAAPGCAAWSLDAAKGLCWLKAASGWTRMAMPGWVSGTSAPAPPAPPVPPPAPPAITAHAAMPGQSGRACLRSITACSLVTTPHPLLLPPPPFPDGRWSRDRPGKDVYIHRQRQPPCIRQRHHCRRLRRAMRGPARLRLLQPRLLRPEAVWQRRKRRELPARRQRLGGGHAELAGLVARVWGGR